MRMSHVALLGLLGGLAASTGIAEPCGGHTVSIAGTRFLLNGEPFPWTGVSFFNAIYNPGFNASSEARRAWLARFRAAGVNVVRVWCQWDSNRGFVDGGPDRTLYTPDGRLRDGPLATLKALLADADAAGVVVEVVLFSHESYREGIRIAADADERAVAALTRELKPWRNAVFQVWNEHHDARVLPLVQVIRSLDPQRLVTSSPGYAGVLGTRDLNEALDFLTPHTSRQGKPWELAPREIESLLREYKKPVVDDEPARCGTAQFGGPKGPTDPSDHIRQIQAVRSIGGHIVYHHDMFQTGYGSPACPPHGVPDPSFSPYHKQVFDYLAREASRARDEAVDRVPAGLSVTALGTQYAPDSTRVVIRQPHADAGGSTSVRNIAREQLEWKRQGYFQRNRDLGQTFTAARDFTLSAIVLRTGPSDAARMETLLREALFPEGVARYRLPPTTDGYPDVDTYRDLEFYIEAAQ